jgi:transposase-like protein
MDEGKVELKERFVELRAAGHSYADIAESIGVSKPTLMSWAEELADELEIARALRWDELVERFAVAKEKRVEIFGKRLDVILAELDKRDLSEVKTEKLLVLALKYGATLREEYEPPKLKSDEGDEIPF